MKQKGNNIEGCILADFMGLGKTLQTLTLIRSVTKMNILNKIVVVCPLTLVRVW
jgi:SNF2 family DNA or RNA helicase